MKHAAVLIAVLALCLSVIALIGQPEASTSSVNIRIINGHGAICENGYISLSRGAGTCSGYGGVKEWINGR